MLTSLNETKKIMPYRRLPTTDKARIRALESAILISDKKEESKLAFSKHMLQELKLVKSNFENTLLQYELDIKNQSHKNKEYKSIMETTVMYLSHFIQVLYMTIERKEIKSEVLDFYELNELYPKLPLLNSEEEILGWGNKIILGEQKRIQKGGSPLYSPSIALVKIKVEEFNDIAIFMQNLQKISLRSFNRIKEIRKSTNDFISRLWTEIEEQVNGEDSKQTRQLAQDYGIIYVFRRKEKKKLKTEGLQTDLVFDFS